MNDKKNAIIPVAMIVAAVVGLAAMGLAFNLSCPIGAWLHPGGNYCFKTQLCWLGIGFAAATCVAAVGWRRIGKIVPWIVAALIGWCAFSGVRAGNGGLRNEERQWVQHQFCGAMAAADWCAGKDVSVRYVPQGMSGGAIASSALMYGKWFPATTIILLSLLASGIAIAAFQTEDRVKRLLAVIVGIAVIGPAVYSLLACLGLAPYLRCMTVPLLSRGGGIIVSTLFMLGAIVAMVLDGNDSDAWPLSKVQVGGIMSVSFLAGAMLVALMAVAGGCGAAFNENRPDMSISRAAWL